MFALSALAQSILHAIRYYHWVHAKPYCLLIRGKADRDMLTCTVLIHFILPLIEYLDYHLIRLNAVPNKIDRYHYSYRYSYI